MGRTVSPRPMSNSCKLDYQNGPPLDSGSTAATSTRCGRGRRHDGADAPGCPRCNGVPLDSNGPPFGHRRAAGSVTAPQLGVTEDAGRRSNLALASGDVPVGSVWRGRLPAAIVLKNDNGRWNARSPTIGTPTSRRRCLRSACPCARLTSGARMEPEQDVHRNGMRCITVTSDLNAGANAMRMTSRFSDHQSTGSMVLPRQASPRELGGAHELDWETIPPIASGLSISLVDHFLLHPRQIRQFRHTLVVMASMSLCLFRRRRRAADRRIHHRPHVGAGFITCGHDPAQRNPDVPARRDKPKSATYARLAPTTRQARMVPIFLTTRHRRSSVPMISAQYVLAPVANDLRRHPLASSESRSPSSIQNLKMRKRRPCQMLCMPPPRACPRRSRSNECRPAPRT